jgi:AcrR family transcriptional regulator
MPKSTAPTALDSDWPPTGKTALRSDSRATVATILEAAALVIGQKGTRALKMARVALRAGVARSTLYEYFPTRAALLCALEQSGLMRVPCAASAPAAPATGAAAVRQVTERTLATLFAYARARGDLVAGGSTRTRRLVIDGVVRDLTTELASPPLAAAVRRPDRAVALRVAAQIVATMAWHAARDLADSAASGALQRELADLVVRYLVDAV